MLRLYLGASWSLGPRRASAALRETRGCFVWAVLAGAQLKEGAVGQHSPPLHTVRGGSLPEVLGVPGLPGCPEGRKRWGHCRGAFSPVGAWGVPRERTPRQCQQLW